MSEKLITAKVSQRSLELLRLIAQITGEKQYRALERILLAEVERLQREQPKEQKP